VFSFLAIIAATKFKQIEELWKRVFRIIKAMTDAASVKNKID
jgi:hypothetical protein